MLNKEIEKLLDCSNCKFAVCEQCEISYTDKEKIRKYTEQLESDKQKLIEKLKEDIEELEFLHDNYIDGNVIEGTYETLGRINYAQEILKIVKGEKNELSS